MTTPLPPPSIGEQIEVLERQIRDLHESNADSANQIADTRVARDLECLEATAGLLRTRNSRLTSLSGQ